VLITSVWSRGLHGRNGVLNTLRRTASWHCPLVNWSCVARGLGVATWITGSCLPTQNNASLRHANTSLWSTWPAATGIVRTGNNSDRQPRDRALCGVWEEYYAQNVRRRRTDIIKSLVVWCVVAAVKGKTSPTGCQRVVCGATTDRETWSP